MFRCFTVRLSNKYLSVLKKVSKTLRRTGLTKEGHSRVASKDSKNGKVQEEVWKEREKRLEELLGKEGENPKAKEDFNRLLEETVRRNSR